MAAASRKKSKVEVEELASELHRAVLRLLRELRVHDVEAGTTTARLSMLSLIVFAGMERPSDLAQAEQVSLPTVSRMLKGMEEEGLVRREADAVDGRASRIRATARGKRIIEAARQARLDDLSERLLKLSAVELGGMEKALSLLKRLQKN